MTDRSQKRNDGAAAPPSAGSAAEGQHSSAAGAADGETAAATLQPPGPIGGKHPLKVRAASAADPFFSGRQHYPALDGLRALAVVAVISLHVRAYMGPQLPEGSGLLSRLIFTATHHGAWGVDLFFVLSGYLITGILLQSRGQQHYFRNFYARRTLRIFPLYYGTLLGLLVLVPLILGGVPGWLRNGYDYQFWLWTYTTNVKDCISGEVFRNFSQFWTLAIEEQFYLVWPLVVFLVPAKRLLPTIGLLVALINIWRLAFWFSHSHIVGVSTVWVWIFAFTPFRADSLLAGGAIAVLQSQGRLQGLRPAMLLLFPAASLATLACYFGMSRRYGWAPDALMTQVTAAPFVLGSLVGIVMTSRPSSWLVRGLSLPPLRTLAKYSYAMYVFHLIYLDEQFRPLSFPRVASALHSVLLALIFYYAYGIGVAFILAFCSYHLYEKHFLKLKKYFPERARSMINEQ